MRPFALASALVLIACCASTAYAQQHDPPPASVSLIGWQHDLNVALMDQSHGYGGLFYDRGLFRRYTYPMDHEFVIDLITYGFTAEHDAAWYAAPSAFRLVSGSVGTSRFASLAHFRADVPVADRQTVYLDGVLREDLVAQRAFTRLGYGYQLSPRHEVGLHQTYANYKPDLDLSVFYRYRRPALGEVTAEATFLDVANNLIYDVLEVEAVQEDTLRSYERAPLLLTLQASTSALGRWRGELVGGWLPVVTARVASSRQPERHYDWTQRARYAGLLLEYRLPALAVGVVARHQYASVTREAPPASVHTSDYTSTQRASSATAYGLGRLDPWRAQLWLTLEHYADEQRGTDYERATLPTDLDYRERNLLVRAEVSRQPAQSGLRAGLTFIQLGKLDRRDYETLADWLKYYQNALNRRLSLHVGYQVRPGTFVVVGANYDLDGDAFYSDAPRRYDGGFGRVAVTW